MTNTGNAQNVLFCSQVALIFIVVLAALANLSFRNDSQNLWIIVLTSSLGYMMPNPRLKAIKDQAGSSAASLWGMQHPIQDIPLTETTDQRQ